MSPSTSSRTAGSICALSAGPPAGPASSSPPPVGTPPLQLTPVTYDLAEARERFEVVPAAMGVEGLVLKPTAARYAGGRRSSWAKIDSPGVTVLDELTSGTFDQVSSGSRGASP
jgi:hypothetical protein